MQLVICLEDSIILCETNELEECLSPHLVNVFIHFEVGTSCQRQLDLGDDQLQMYLVPKLIS